MTGQWRTISVALEANVGGFIRDLNRAETATRGFGTSVDANTTKAGSSIREFAKGAALIGGGVVAMHAFVEAGKLAVGQAISWESAFAGVEKTVDGTTQQLAALEAGIISMANRIPATREEIASVAEAAGQLGIATPNILGFTETMIGLGEATNLSATEAATQLARLANITQMPQSEFENLGSSVVALGNNFATTEAEIVAMSLRIASAGQQVGLTEAEITGLAAALSSVGIEAEAGGSAISRVMIDIATAVDQGGDKLAKLAEVAGMTGEQFANLWTEDSSAALVAFVEGLGTAEARGMSLFGVMEELGFADIRVGNALRSLAGAGDLLADSLGVSTRAWEENSALTDEVAKRYATAESQLRTFANQATNVARVAGAQLVPMLLAVVDGIRELARWAADVGGQIADRFAPGFESLVDAGESIVAALLNIASGAEPVLKVLGGIALIVGSGAFNLFAEALQFIASVLDLLAPALPALGAGMAGYAVAAGGATLATGAYATAATAGALASNALAAGLTVVQVAAGSAAFAVGSVVAAAAAWYVAYQKWQAAGRDRAADWFTRLDEESELSVASLEKRAAMASQLADQLGGTLSKGLSAYTVDIDFNAETSASIDEANRQAEAYAMAASKMRMAAEAAGLTTTELAAALTELEIDPTTASTLQMVAAIREWASANGALTPSAAAAASAIEEQNKAIEEGVDAVMERWDAEQRLVGSQRAVVDAQEGVQDAHRQVAQAQRGVSDAAKGVQDAYRAVTDAARGLQDAQRGVADAQRQAQEASQELAQAQADALFGTRELEQANRGVTEAESALAQAQRDSLVAQEDLDAARGRAVRNLEDLDRAARGAALSEERAVLALEEARERLANPKEDADANDRKRAALDVEAAELALEEARVRNADAAARLAEAEAKGIENSDAVVGAKEAITTALGNEQAAEEALDEARQRVTEVQEQLAQRVVDAQGRVEEANLRVEEAQYRVEAAALRVRDAQDQVVAAQQRLVDQRQAVVDARKGVEEAERRVEEAAIDAALAQYDYDLKTQGATTAVQNLRTNLDYLAGDLDPNNPLRSRLQGFIDQLLLLDGLSVPGVTPGPWKSGLVPHRWGAIDHYAGGGIRQAQMGTGSNRIWWDEPQTGGEAYVPRLGDPSRSLPILATAAGWYGHALTPAGGGGASVAPGAVQVIAPQNAPASYVAAVADHMLAAAASTASP